MGIGGMERVMSILLPYFVQSNNEIHLVLIGRQRDIIQTVPSEVIIHKPKWTFDNRKRTWHAIKTMYFLRINIKQINPDVILSFGEYWNNLVLLSLVGTNFPVYISDRSKPGKDLGKGQNWLRDLLYPRAAGYIAQTSQAANMAQIPIEFKSDSKSGKKILKDIVHDYVPKEMMDRPKAGFSLPIYSWLRGDLAYLVDEYLSKEALAQSGLFNIDFLLREIEKFKKRKLHYSPVIWYLLMFQMWYKEWIK